MKFENVDSTGWGYEMVRRGKQLKWRRRRRRRRTKRRTRRGRKLEVGRKCKRMRRQCKWSELKQGMRKGDMKGRMEGETEKRLEGVRECRVASRERGKLGK